MNRNQLILVGATIAVAAALGALIAGAVISHHGSQNHRHRAAATTQRSTSHGGGALGALSHIVGAATHATHPRSTEPTYNMGVVQTCMDAGGPTDDDTSGSSFSDIGAGESAHLNGYLGAFSGLPGSGGWAEVAFYFFSDPAAAKRAEPVLAKNATITQRGNVLYATNYELNDSQTRILNSCLPG